MTVVAANEHWVTIDSTISLRRERCHECGGYYHVEARHDSECPYCAKAARTRLNAELDQLNRSNAALRGHLKRGRK